MMGAPLLLADNLGNPNLYQKVIVTDQSGTSGVVGFEAWRAFAGRRSAFSYWAPGTPNIESWLQLQHEQVRAANFIALDRGHNLGGFAVKLQGSQDAATWATILSVTIPTVWGGVLNSGMGVLTEEGAWLMTFPTTAPALAYTYWRFDIPAMGVGLQPNVVGLQLGLSYQPLALYRPFMEHRTTLRSQTVLTPFGWMGRGQRAFNRSGVLNLRADVNDYEYLQARLTVEEIFGSGRPMWVIQDQDRASEAVQVIRPDGDMGFERPTQLFWPTASIQVVEHEPLAVN
jgi:hypothetical protein